MRILTVYLVFLISDITFDDLKWRLKGRLRDPDITLQSLLNIKMFFFIICKTIFSFNETHISLLPEQEFVLIILTREARLHLIAAVILSPLGLGCGPNVPKMLALP